MSPDGRHPFRVDGSAEPSPAGPGEARSSPAHFVYSLVREVDTPVGLAFLAIGYSAFDGSAPDADLVSVGLPLCPAVTPIGKSATMRAVETPDGLAFLAIGISGLKVSSAGDCAGQAAFSALIAPASGVLISSSINLFLVDLNVTLNSCSQVACSQGGLTAARIIQAPVPIDVTMQHRVVKSNRTGGQLCGRHRDTTISREQVHATYSALISA
jgi:hypothetical protein